FLKETLPVSLESSRSQIPQQKPELKKMKDDRKRKGGNKLEQNTKFEIPEDVYADYCTRDEEIHGKEIMVKRKIRLQKIERRWAMEYEPRWPRYDQTPQEDNSDFPHNILSLVKGFHNGTELTFDPFVIAIDLLMKTGE
ncbi:hypothetical protein ZWY2020_040298, partial [Hordeum vulgare]